MSIILVDFERLGREAGFPTLPSGHHHCSKDHIQTHCPFCAAGISGWHLGYNTVTGGFSCWRCGSLRRWDVFAALLHVRPAQVMGRIRPYILASPLRSRREHRSAGSLIQPPGLGTLHHAHKQYLRGRGFDPVQLARDWQVQGTRWRSGEWNWRVVYPVFAASGKIVAYQGRAIADDAIPRYKMSDEDEIACDPRTLLYGIHCVPGDSVVIVEGAFDVWRIGPGAIATFGIAWKQEQATQLRRFRRRYVLFDPELEAQLQAERLARYLSQFEGQTEIISGLETDPGGMSGKQARHLVQLLRL